MTNRPWFNAGRVEDTKGKKKDRRKANRLRRRRTERAWQKEDQQ